MFYSYTVELDIQFNSDTVKNSYRPDHVLLNNEVVRGSEQRTEMLLSVYPENPIFGHC
jgi:hypothetical protein